MSSTPENRATKSARIFEHKGKTITDLTSNYLQDKQTTLCSIASTIFSLWQLGERPGLFQPPSLIFVTPTAEAAKNSEMIRNALFNNEHRLTADDFAKYSDTNLEFAGKVMSGSLEMLKRTMASPRPVEEHLVNYLKMFRSARDRAYGMRFSYPYSQAYHEELGLITDELGASSLSITAPQDFRAFMNDLTTSPTKITSPTGPHAEITSGKVITTVNGSIPMSSFDSVLVNQTLALGQPFLFLPHSGKEPHMPNRDSLVQLGKRLPGGQLIDGDRNYRLVAFPEQIEQENQVAVDTLGKVYDRLAYFPIQARYPYIQLLHQLNTVVTSLTNRIMTISDEGKTEPIPMRARKSYSSNTSQILYSYGVKSVLLNLKTLAWHAYGFELAIPVEQAQKILNLLRSEGPMSLRDLQRRARLKSAAIRDVVLDQLQEAHLVRIEEKQSHSVSWEEFSTFVFSPEIDRLLYLPPS